MFLIILFLIFVLLSIVYSSIKYGITPMPTSHRLGKAIVNLLDEKYSRTIYELGCGFGTMNILVAKRCRQAKVIAYEASYFPYLCALLLKYIFRCRNLTIYNQNFLQADLEDHNTIFCYLSVGNMQKLERKLSEEGFRGKLISHTFALPNNEPVSKTSFNDLYRTPIYVYLI